MSTHTLQGSSVLPKAELNYINNILLDGNPSAQNTPGNQQNRQGVNTPQNDSSSIKKQNAGANANKWEEMKIESFDETVIPQGMDIRLSSTDDRRSNQGSSSNQSHSNQNNKNQGNDGRGEVKHPESDRRLKENK